MLDAEHFVAVLLEHRRGERAEPLAKLDLMIEDLAHIAAARVGNEAAGTECSRPQFHTAVEPPDDRTVGDHSGDPRQQYVVVKCLVFKARRIEDRTALF